MAFAYRTECGRAFSFWTHGVRAFSFWTQPCQGIFLLDAAVSGVKILTSVLCVGSTGNVVPRRAYFVGLLVRGSALGLCLFSSLAQASTSHCFR